MKIKLVAMDVDGTLTDGGVYMNGEEEFKKFDVRDGYGIVDLLKNGLEAAFVSGRYSPSTDQRAENLGVSKVFNGTDDKMRDLENLSRELGLSSGEVAFIGDDIPDIPCIKWAGLGIAVGDAADEVKAEADVVTNAYGGRGAVREAAEYIMKLNGDRAAS
jgi:3-deoxy-D-manno-octulosonate 8-phosphate phosphatase (KDO 8-P phosphatase)